VGTIWVVLDQVGTIWVVLDQVGTIWVVLERNVSLLRRLFSFLFH
jgi:hypothetical protein